MDEKLIEEIRDLVRNDKFTFTNEGRVDVFDKNMFTIPLVKEAFEKGIICEDCELYPDDPDEKFKGKNYYCLHKYRSNLIYVRSMLISFLKEEKVIIIHSSPMGKENKYYTKMIKGLYL